LLYNPNWLQSTELDGPGKILIDAANYFSDHGWCQGTTTDKEGNKCILGALCYVVEKNRYNFDDYFIASRRLKNYTKSTVYSWNDAKGRTKEQVVELLNKVAYHK
jgi:hypothetical protein